MNTPTNTPRPPQAPEVDYESRDTRTRPLLAFAGALAVLLFVTGLAMGGLFHWFSAELNRSPRNDTEPAAMDATRELHELRRREDEILGSYAWVSREEGIVRIPVDRAIELYIQQQKDSQP